MTLVDNVSDHLPLSTVIIVNITKSETIDESSNDAPNFLNVDWTNSVIANDYQRYVEDALASVSVIDHINIGSMGTEFAQTALNRTSDTLCSIMHDSAKKAVDKQRGNSVYKGTHSINHWWSSDCTLARDLQRMWYSIWKSSSRTYIHFI